MSKQKNIPTTVVAFLCCCQFVVAQQKKYVPMKAEPVKHGTTPVIVPPVAPSYFNDHDTSYYHSFERYITARLFFSKKFTSVELERASKAARFRYIPNTDLTMGVGVTYQSITINLGYGFGFLNPVNEKGKTRYLDLQSRIYGRSWTIDLLAQFYKGYYLATKGLAASNPSAYYVRPDLNTQLFGVSAYHVFNSDRFSYRAALLQNEKQKKSAGSLLVGADIYYGFIKADSSLVPTILADNYTQKNLRRLDFFKIGPGIGYAYTVVINQDFFVMGSLSGNLNFDYSKQQGMEGKTDKFAVNPGFIYRLVAGYDKNNWNINLSLVGNQMKVSSPGSADNFLLGAGDLRLTFAKRITPGKDLSRRLHRVDRVIENVKGQKTTHQ